MAHWSYGCHRLALRAQSGSAFSSRSRAADDAAKQHGAHEGPERAQGQRRGKNHQHTARIHWVADDPVGSARNDTLARLHFDNAGSPSVLPQREKDDVVTHRD